MRVFLGQWKRVRRERVIEFEDMGIFMGGKKNKRRSTSGEREIKVRQYSIFKWKEKSCIVEDFRIDNVLRQESCIILQRGFGVGGGIKLIVLKFKERIFMSQMRK